MSTRFGAKNMLALSIGVGSILTLGVPVIANVGSNSLMFFRFLTGVAHVCVYAQ